MQDDARLDPRRVDHGHVAHDHPLGPQPPQPTQDRRFRQADRFGRDPRRFLIVATHPIQQTVIERIQRDEIRHIIVPDAEFRRIQAGNRREAQPYFG